MEFQSHIVVTSQSMMKKFGTPPYRYQKTKNRLLKFCYVPATSAAHSRLLSFLFLLCPFKVLMKQTRQAVRAIKQSIFLDVYAPTPSCFVYKQVNAQPYLGSIPSLGKLFKDYGRKRFYCIGPP
jgi:hypothetical protein